MAATVGGPQLRASPGAQHLTAPAHFSPRQHGGGHATTIPEVQREVRSWGPSQL